MARACTVVSAAIQRVHWARMQFVARGTPGTTAYDHLSTASRSSGTTMTTTYRRQPHTLSPEPSGATFYLSRTFRLARGSRAGPFAAHARGPVCSPCTRARLQPMHPMHGCVGVSFGSREKGPTRCFRGRKHMNQDGAMPNRKACHRSPGIQTVLEACDKGQPPPSGTIEPTRVWFKPRPRPVCIVPLFHCRRRHLESPLPARRSMHIREPTWSIMQARSRQHQRMPVRCLWGSWHAW